MSLCIKPQPPIISLSFFSNDLPISSALSRKTICDSASTIALCTKMSGGHRERKDKLLEEQKKGKARLKKFGKVEIPQEAFLAVLQIEKK